MQSTTIVTFINCPACMREIPDGVSPRDWMLLEFGLNAESNLVVWCVRHDRHLVTLLMMRSE